METRLFVGIVGLSSAFACLFAAVLAAGGALRKRRGSMAAQGERFTVAGIVAWRLRNGITVLKPAARRLLRFKSVSKTLSEIAQLLYEAQRPASPESVLSVAIGALGILGVAVGAISGSAVAAVAVPLCALAVAYISVGSLSDKRNEAIRESAPGALESMSACFSAGFTLLQTFNQVAEDVPGHLGTTFARSAHVLETGGSAEQALAVLREGAHASEIAFVAVALDVQHQSGGSMRQVLDAARDSMKSELALRRSLRVQTAQAKLSARIVVAMPFVLLAAFSLASPDFLSPFFSSTLGYALLALAITMQAAGVFLVHRALSVDGAS